MSATRKDLVYEFDFTCCHRGQFAWRRVVGGVGEPMQKGSYRLNVSALPDWALNHLQPLQADLMDVALAAHISDRFSPRRHEYSGDKATAWSRRIVVRVAVRELEKWRDPEVVRRFCEYLGFNTGDDWQFVFVPRPPDAVAAKNSYLQLDMQETLRRRYPELRISLFSDGLDSLAGLAQEVSAHPDARFLLVSFNTTARITTRQAGMLTLLEPDLRKRITHLPLSLTVCAGAAKQEKSRRTRGLIFLAAASVTAILSGQSEFSVWENGIGAFNLPHDRSQLTGHSTRAVHPRSLALFASFMEVLFERSLRIRNDFQFSTKGEICRLLSDAPWHELIAKSFTCGYARRIPEKGHQHCGVCVSCIMRRQGLRVAGLSADDVEYFYDLNHAETVLPHKQIEWHKMQRQMEQFAGVLRAVESEGENFDRAWLHVARAFPDLIATTRDMANAQAVDEKQIQRGIISLLHKYVGEGLLLSPSLSQVLPLRQQVNSIVESIAA